MAQTAGTTTTPAVYAGQATAQALKVSILGQTGTFGVSKATADSTPAGTADGTAAVLPDPLGIQGETKASLGETKPQTCVGSTPAQLASLVSVGLGCSSASVVDQGGYPVSTATGTVGQVALDTQSILNNSPANQLTQPVTDTLNTLLSQVCTSLDATCPVTNTVQQLVQSVVQTRALQATVGDATATVTSSAASITSQGTANAATIEILPDAVLNGTPLGAPFATIQVAKAGAAVTCDLTSGKGTTNIDPSLVTIKLAAPVFAALPATTIDQLQLAKIAVDASTATITVAPGQSLIVPGTAGTPLETEIVVAGGSTTNNPDGSTTATSDGVKVNALKGINGGVLLDLAHAEAVGGCAAPQTVAAPPAPPTPSTPAELPRTGGTAPWLPIAGLAGLGLALATRRVLVRTR
ncbi:MAG TPA: hypothetical protein VHN98_09635 [Acidimicrobiales bacterium]|nr:hypothetical protein [Acidimicrobiales bacterium]